MVLAQIKIALSGTTALARMTRWVEAVNGMCGRCSGSEIVHWVLYVRECYPPHNPLALRRKQKKKTHKYALSRIAGVRKMLYTFA